MELLRQFDYNPIICHDPDEVRQCGLQGGGVILFFDQIDFAHRYLSENDWRGFPVNKFLWHPNESSVLPSERRMMEEVGLKLFTTGQEKDLLQFLEICLDNVSVMDDLLSKRGEE